jgi:exosome complex component RRP4
MEKQIVVPGEEIKTKSDDYVYTEKGKKYSMVYGLFYSGERGKVVPLKGKYLPNDGDYIVGIITDVRHGGYSMDINSPYSAYLMSKRKYDFGDIVFAKVSDVNEVKSSLLSYDKGLYGGDILEVSPTKIPRIIGKKNSMIDLLQQKTGCEIYVGRNGRIWLKGKNPTKAEEAIRIIEKEAHTDGLTERITKFLGD